ncbi:MAG TPA: EamA family transporter [Polyangia bacterium]
MTPPSAASPRPAEGALPWLAFTACGAIWGSTFLVISIGNDSLAPVWAAALRLVAAALLLAAWTRARGQSLPRGPALRAALAYGVCQFGVNLPLLYWGEKRVPSGLAAVAFATIPLSSALVTRALGMEKLTRAKVAGACLALAGVAVLFSGSLAGDVAPLGLGAILLAATMAALGTVLLKRGPRQDPIGANAVACAIGAAVSMAASFALGEVHALPGTLGALLSLAYLTLAGSLGAFVIMSWLINHWPVTRTAYVSVIVPVIALGLGIAVRGERLTAVSLAGAALVLVGLITGMTGRPRLASENRLDKVTP